MTDTNLIILDTILSITLIIVTIIDFIIYVKLKRKIVELDSSFDRFKKDIAVHIEDIRKVVRSHSETITNIVRKQTNIDKNKYDAESEINNLKHFIKEINKCINYLNKTVREIKKIKRN